MRVVHVTPHYAPSTGGIETHVAELARRAMERGHDVEVITSSVPGAPAPDRELVDGVPVHRLPAWGPTADLRVPLGLVRELRRRIVGSTVVHAHNYHAAPAALAALAWPGPLVVTPHFHGSGHNLLTRALHVPYRYVGRTLFRSADRIICVSAAEEHLLHDRFPATGGRTSVIPNGIAAEAIRSASPFDIDRSIVLTVGRLEPYKHVDSVIRAMAHIDEGTELVVIGKGRAEGDLRALAAASPSSDRIRLLGGVPVEELRRWLRTADVFVTMSHHEAFGITLAEALAGGARAVASDIPAHREIAGMVDEGAVALIARDASDEELASTIRQRLTESEPPLGTRRLPGWDDVGDRTLAVYDEVIAASTRH